MSEASTPPPSPETSPPPPQPGTVGWIDLTTGNTEAVRDFYQKVVGWQASGVPMDGYEDWCMLPSADSPPTAGICHRQGSNAEVPTGWMVYFVVADLEQSMADVVASGGKVVGPPRGDDGKFALIADPEGATCALYQA